MARFSTSRLLCNRSKRREASTRHAGADETAN